MADATIFPAFVRMQYQDDGSAKSEFLRAVDQMARDSETRLKSAEERFKEMGKAANQAVTSALAGGLNSFGAFDLGSTAVLKNAQALNVRAMAARDIANAMEEARRAEGDYSETARLAVAAARAQAIEEENGAQAAFAHARALEQVQSKLNSNASALSASAQAIRAHAIANDNASVSAGRHRAGMQQLGFQINDLGIQLGMAATSSKPMTMALMAITQQGAQAIQAVQMMTSSTSRLGAVLGNPWVTVALAAASVIATFRASISEAGDAVDKVQLSSSSLGAAQQALGGIFDITTGKTRSQTSATLALAKAQIILAQASSRKNLAEANSKIAASQDPAWHLTGGMGGGFSITRDRDIQGQVASQFRNGIIDANGAIDSLKRMRDAGRITDDTFTELAAAYANQATESRNLSDLDKAYSSLIEGRLAPSLRTATREHGAHARGLSEAAREAQSLSKALWGIADDVAQAMGSGGALTKRVSDDLAGILTEAGVYRNAMREEMGRRTDDRTQLFREAAAATAEWNARLDDAASRLSAIGNLGSSVAKVTSAIRGNFGALSGSTGLALSAVWALPAASQDGKFATLGDRIENIFKADGAFGKTMESLLAGAGTGGAFSTVMFGQNNQAAQIGGMVGGAVGKEVGEKIGTKLTGTLGKLAGPLGSIAGGLLGGALGSLFSTKPRGSGSVSNTSVTSSANNDGIKASIDSFGLGLQQAVSSIADKLGAKVGTYSVGLGRYKDYYQVSSSGIDPYLGQTYYNRKREIPRTCSVECRGVQDVSTKDEVDTWRWHRWAPMGSRL